jgi:hypothetical protein
MKNLIIVDDNADNREQFLRLLEDTEHKVTAVGDIREAGSCDVLLIDVSSVCPPRQGKWGIYDTQNAYAPICAYLEQKPGCTVIIHTAMSRHTAAIIGAEVVERCPDTQVKIADIMDWSETLRMIEES